MIDDWLDPETGRKIVFVSPEKKNKNRRLKDGRKCI
jgi:hypothetical protein